jgi:uncharacterized protein YutE (UPF0331/DUF86 family)
MTPRRLDPATVQARLQEIRLLIGDLKDLGPVSGSRLERDRYTRHVAERVLSQIVELATAINTHITAALLDRAPRSYRDSFLEIALAGVMDRDFAETLAPSTGLRNALVHDYLEVDLERVAAAVPMAIEQYGRYVELVAGWLLKRLED